MQSNLLIIASVSAVAAAGLLLYFCKRCRCKMAKCGNILLKDPDTKYEVKLVEKEEISHDTRRFRFGLHSPDQSLGLPVGVHIQLVMKINGELVIRPYTPISLDDQKGSFDLVIKVYHKDVHPKYPAGGKMTQFLDSLKIGEPINVKGPVGRIFYKGCGEFSIRKEPKKTSPFQTYHFKHIGLIAGGSGITPIYQLMQAITKNPNDKTTMSLVYANQSENDILLRSQIEEVAAKHPEQFKFWYTIDRATPGWKYSTGFINEDMLRDHLPAASEDAAVFMCGPPPMINGACIPNLEKLGYTENNYFKF